MERLQGCFSGSSQHGWWVVWDDSQHIENLIEWAEIVIDDMGRKAQKRSGKVCLHHSLPLSSLESTLCQLVSCDVKVEHYADQALAGSSQFMASFALRVFIAKEGCKVIWH